MGELPVLPAATTAVPPALRYRVREVLAQLPTDGAPLEGTAAERLARLLEDGEPWLGADPALAEIGAWMTEAGRAPELRRRGCQWLAMFPSVDSVRRLAAVALDPAAPPPVRDEAIASLGCRQLRALHPETRWPAEAVQLADEALLRLADAATAEGKLGSDRLPHALRHVSSDALAAVLARAPRLWGEAIECFATPPLGRVLLVSIDDIPPRHRLRALRLIAAVLGEEAVPLLLSRARTAEPELRLEMLLLAIACGGEAHLPRLEEALAVPGVRQVGLVRARAGWHLANRGVIPAIRGLRVARTSALIPPEDRAARCAQAADDLAAPTVFARYAEPYVYALWAWMVRGAADPARAKELVAAHPASQRLVRDLSFEDLARRGRVAQLVSAAHELGGLDTAALLLAIWGRPLAALELAAAARHHTPELGCARVLACYRAGRPDLAERVLAADPPPAELVEDGAPPAFPGPHEQWLIGRAPDARPALAALAGGAEAVIALARPVPHDAEPDATALDPIAAVERRVSRALRGATVFIAGELPPPARAAIAAAIAAAGARLAPGPLPGTDYFLEGEGCPAHLIARLLRDGTRRLLRDELGGEPGGDR
ncbi:MAG TPA: hypothetical protein VNO30_24590 [Kofleriaceae bacterium]|nr:hypothetical protein [Kofleriaceae bacterium]